MSEEFRERGMLLSREFSQKVAEGILIEDREILDKFIAQLCESKDVLYVYIYDKSGLTLAQKVLFEGIENGSPPKAELDNIEIAGLLFDKTKHDTVMDISTPVSYEDERVGYIRLGISLERIGEKVDKRILNSSILVAIFISIGLVMCFFFSRSLSKPISHLLEGVKKIGQGDLSHHVTVQNRDEIGELAVAFNQMTDDLRLKTTSIDNLKRAEADLKSFSDRLEESNRELTDFAYVASHDLQEPLRKVTGFGSRLKAKYADTVGEEGRDYIDRMMNAAARMQKLIEGLLDYSRVTTKARPFTPTDLSTVVHEVLSDLEIRIEQTGAKVELSDLPTVDADPLQMRQLFQNLIGNALKFNKPDQPPVVNVSAESPGSGTRDDTSPHNTTITIKDNGIGFDEKYTDRIFGVFQRLHGRKEYEGTGIGLSVCKKIVERHGGSITAKSTPGKGSAFIITMPAG